MTVLGYGVSRGRARAQERESALLRSLEAASFAHRHALAAAAPLRTPGSAPQRPRASPPGDEARQPSRPHPSQRGVLRVLLRAGPRAGSWTQGPAGGAPCCTARLGRRGAMATRAAEPGCCTSAVRPSFGASEQGH